MTGNPTPPSVRCALFALGMGASLSALKVSGVVTWPWWAVLLPLWGPPVFVASMFWGAALVVLIARWGDSR